MEISDDGAHEHMDGAGAPGASAPGEPGYQGRATVGDEGAAAGPEAFLDQTGRPGDVEGLDADAVPPAVREAWARAEQQDPR